MPAALDARAGCLHPLSVDWEHAEPMVGRRWRPLSSSRTRAGLRVREAARALARFTTNALKDWAAQPRAVLRVALNSSILVLAWAQLYAELLRCGGEGLSLGWLSDDSTTVLLFLAAGVAGLLLCEGFGALRSGILAYGRVFASQKVFWAGILTTFAIFLVTLLSLWGRWHWLLSAVPVCALARLLLSPVVDEPGRAFTRVTALLRKRSVDLEGVLRAVDGIAPLGEPERRTLRDVAREVDRQAVACEGAGKRKWNEADLRHFLRAAEVALTGPRHRRPWSATEACLFRLVDCLGSSPLARDNYGIFASLVSGLRQLAHGGLQELAVFCAAAVLDGCLGPLQACLISLLTRAAMEGDRDAAFRQIGAYMGSYALGMAAYGALVYSYSALLTKGTASVQRRVAAKMMAMGSKEHAAYPNGSVNAMFASDVTRLQDLWTGVTWSLLSPLMKVMIAVMYAIYASPQVGILALTVFPLIFVTVPQSRSSSVAASYSVANSETISMFQNGVDCQPMIWSCDKQGEWLKRYLEPKITDQRRSHMMMRLWGGIVQAYVQQLVSLFVAVHVSILAWLAATGGISVAEFTGFVSLFSSLGTPSISLGGFYRVAVACAGSAQRVDEFLQEGMQPNGATFAAEAAPEDDPEAPCCPAAHWDDTYVDKEPQMPGDLVVSSVSYRYPGTSKPTIEDVSFAVRPGDFASIVGGSGCGKSTLLSLLMTWLQPESGCVRIGRGLTFGPGGQGAGAAAAVARQLRDRVAVVFQETMLLRGTVHENIAISAPGEVTRADVEWAAAAAGCAEFITSQLPDGYDTMLGAEGASLSGGQAQRICIARALCRKPSVLLLDEATSALDPRTAGQILKTIAGLSVNYRSVFSSLIVVSITHHPDSLMYSNLVVHMDAGHVNWVEQRPMYRDTGRPGSADPGCTEASAQRQEPEREVSPGVHLRDGNSDTGQIRYPLRKCATRGSGERPLDPGGSANALRAVQATPSHTATLLGG